jgi:hypothetical protein
MNTDVLFYKATRLNESQPGYLNQKGWDRQTIRLRRLGLVALMMLFVVGLFLSRGIDARWLIAAGLIIMGIGNYWMSQMNLDISSWQVVWPRCVVIGGLSMIFAPIVKTIFILRYIHEEKIRRRVQLQLNRGEARHELARWLFFANRGEFRTGDYEEIMNKASCLSLLSNAVLVWNTIKIGNIVEQLRAAGEQIDDADLSRVSPLAHRGGHGSVISWQHIKPAGRV